MNHTGATLVLVLAMLTQSCATWMFPYATLVPEALPPDVKGNITHSGRTKIKLEEMKLRVETRNSSPVHGFSWSWILFPVFSFPSPSYGDVKDTFHAPLIVYIDFSAEVEGYSFHPSEVSIEQGERGPTAPAGFTGPGRTRDERCEGPGHSDLPRFGTEGVSPIKPGGRTCFVLAFDTDLADEAPIRLAIHGLQKDGQEVAVPDLTLTKREARAFLGPRIWNPWQGRRSIDFHLGLRGSSVVKFSMPLAIQMSNPYATVTARKTVVRGGRAAGVVLYDETGAERSGYLTFSPTRNVVLTLDNTNPDKNGSRQTALLAAGPDGNRAAFHEPPVRNPEKTAMCQEPRQARSRFSDAQLFDMCVARSSEAACRACLATK